MFILLRIVGGWAVYLGNFGSGKSDDEGDVFHLLWEIINMKIIIGLTEHIGDIIACEPVVRYLREKHPKAHISWVVFAAYRELIDTNPQIDETVVVDCLTDWMKLSKHGAFDLIVDLHVNYRVCPHCRIPLVKERGNPFVNIYEWFDYGALLESFSQGAGLPKLSGQPKLYLTQEHRDPVEKLGLPENYFVIHRQSNDFDKDWGAENWPELVKTISHETGLRAVDIGMQRDGLPSPLGDLVIDLLSKTPLLQTAEVIRRAKFFVGVDSGPAHMANALQVPGIVLLGKYNVFRQYNPYTGFYASKSPRVRLVRNILGPARELPLHDVVEATRYVAGVVLAPEAVAPEPVSDAIAILPSDPVRDNLPTVAQLQKNHAPDTSGAPGHVAGALPDEARIFAFYLSQFHPIAENNYGHRPGFTEWDNVIKSKPLFRGHDQPRIPGELGYYDLRSIDVMREQVRLAQEHGVTGFCFYYYYFQGRRLLQTPVDNYIKSDIKAPFFFLWANENWSRRWDGGDKEIIIAQNHNDEDDLSFIRGLLDVFADERYVKIDGKPILMIYKTHLFPDIRRSTDLWRDEVVKHGFPDLFLVMVDDWTSDPPVPREMGFDASYEIPSNIVQEECLIKDHEALDVVEGFTGRIVDYQKFASYHMGRPTPIYKRFRTVMAPWDNTSRYGSTAMVQINHQNDSYKLWLTNALLSTYENFPAQERIVFLHSWNEWCEGTYVEPDGKTGRRLLEETRQAVADVRTLISQGLTGKSLLDQAKLYRALQYKEEGALRTFQALRQQNMYIYRDLGTLHSRIEERARAEREAIYASVYASTSWRVTKPLRVLSRVIARLAKLARV